MSLFDFFRIPGVQKTLRYGEAVKNVLRSKVEKKLRESERKHTCEVPLNPIEEIENELRICQQQFKSLAENPRVIGFLAVDFFPSKAWNRHRNSISLTEDSKTTLIDVYQLLGRCNDELENLEVRKDGFVKGQLQKGLLKEGPDLISRALEIFRK